MVATPPPPSPLASRTPPKQPPVFSNPPPPQLLTASPPSTPTEALNSVRSATSMFPLNPPVESPLWATQSFNQARSIHPNQDLRHPARPPAKQPTYPRPPQSEYELVIDRGLLTCLILMLSPRTTGLLRDQSPQIPFSAPHVNKPRSPVSRSGMRFAAKIYMGKHDRPTSEAQMMAGRAD